jgi:transcriptional regulator with XRE-family HTH domain
MELADYRKQKSWTLAHVAGLVGLSNASAVRKQELGLVMPRPETLEAYSRVTNGEVTADDFARVFQRRRNGDLPKAA